MCWCSTETIQLAVCLTMVGLLVHPCPLPAQEGKSVRDLRIVTVIASREDADFFNGILREDDIVVTYGPKRWLLERISKPKIMISRQSIADLRDALRRIKDIRVSYINYNPEQWKGSRTPREEIADLPKAVKAARAVAEEYGVKFGFGTDYILLRQHGREVAPLVDLFGIQLQRYQRLPLDKFVEEAERKVAIVKKGNPRVPIALQLSMAPPQFEVRKIGGVEKQVVVRDQKGGKLLVPEKAEAVLERIEAIKHLAGAIVFIYTDESRPELRRLVRMLRP